ncbi:hypothetical protein CNMCM5793_001414 [Aspergillus hiratsukae]|uniref:NACHT domain-containing protein n=1 Tax=Aspergillus hiratsukae TaxID=1194566 RepID=A0A8H6USV7_9EURO|nr:hypothetical protein CNMCM5793_001414 [Aspergillus hiratsukae]KAF7164635.1 hypothetical protein CNMCM6106_001087 [Aspergillus hiratsukae]
MFETTLFLILPGGMIYYHSLWASAIASLSDSQRAFIDFRPDNKLEALSELLRYTNEQRDRCVGKSWRWKRKDGEVVIVRDLLAKVASWAIKFRDMGDLLIQMDPVHAALPWVGVRFLIQSVVSDFQNYNCLLEGAALIAEVLCRSSVYEQVLLGLPSTSPAKAELARALTKLYIKILEHLARAKQYLAERTLTRIIKSTLQMHAEFGKDLETIRNAQQDVANTGNIVIMQQQIDGYSQIKQMLHSLETPMQRWDESLLRIRDMLQDETRATILQWLSPQPYYQHHAQMRNGVMKDSGEWLLADPLMTEWKNKSSSSILWLHGIPGSGKSKLVSVVIDDMLRSSEKHLSPPPLYFYCSRNPAEPGRSDSTDIAASFLRQLSSVDGNSLLEPVIREYKERQRTGFSKGNLDLDETRVLIIELLGYYPAATIVLDALDECTPESREELLHMFEYILQESSTLVKIFVSSREDQDIVSELQGYPNLEISSTRNTQDIAAFVHREVQVLKTKRPLRSIQNVDELAKLIIETITAGANGMFLWASLQLQTLRELKTEAAIRERMGHLPKKLSDIYDEILQRIEAYPSAADHAYARNALCWLLCAICPLDINQFLALISLSCNRQVSLDQILDLCCNLVVFDTSSSTFRFAHLSVREYLEAHPKYVPRKSHKVAATACLATLVGSCKSLAAERLSSLTLPLPGETPKREAFLYAGMFWCEHCRLVDPEPDQDEFGQLLWKFLSGEKDESSPFCSWWRRTDSIFIAEPYHYGSRFYGIERRFRTSSGRLGGPSAALLACCFDLSKLVAKFKAERMITADTKNLYGNTCEALASLYQSTTTLRILGVEKIYEGLTTAVDKRTGAVAVLLESLLEEPCDEKKVVCSDVLRLVVSNHADGHKMLDSLLRKFPGGISVTYDLLTCAVASGSCRTVQLLLENTRQDISIDSPLMEMATTNSLDALEIVRFLCGRLKEGIQITEEMVVAAARNYQHGKELVETILLAGESDENPPVTNHMLESLIHMASLETMIFLLDRYGVHGPVTDNMIFQAIRNHRDGKQIINSLHEKYDITDKITERLLISAAELGTKSLFTYLLEHFQTSIEPSSAMLKAAAVNVCDGIDIMEYLLVQLSGNTLITDDVVKTIARRGDCSGMALLLKMAHGRITITHDMAIEAAKNRTWGNEILCLMQTQEPRLDISFDIINAAIRYGSEVTVGRLINILENAGLNLPVESAAVAAARCQEGPESMSLLLTRFGAALPITPEVLHAAARNSTMGDEIVSLLVDTRGDDIHPTAELFLDAASNRGTGTYIMEILMERYRDKFQITNELLETAAHNDLCGEDILRILNAELCLLMTAPLKGRGSSSNDLLCPAARGLIDPRTSHGGSSLANTEQSADPVPDASLEIQTATTPKPDAGCAQVGVTDYSQGHHKKAVVTPNGPTDPAQKTRERFFFALSTFQYGSIEA